MHKGSLAAVQVLVPREAKSKLAPEISVSLGEMLGHNAVDGTPPFPGITALAPSPSRISLDRDGESGVEESEAGAEAVHGPFAGPEGGHWACPAPAPAQQAAVAERPQFQILPSA